MVNLEKWKLWIDKILGKRKMQCRCFCVMCEYYEVCKEAGIRKIKNWLKLTRKHFISGRFL